MLASLWNPNQAVHRMRISSRILSVTVDWVAVRGQRTHASGHQPQHTPARTFTPATVPSNETPAEPSNWTTHLALAQTPFLRTAIATNFGYADMTPVQRLVLDTCVEAGATEGRRDMLVKSKTGTGKTIAFLAAAIHTVLAKRNLQTLPSEKVSILIFSPTRELAVQTSAEARKLLGMKQNSLGRPDATENRVTVVVGGESKKSQVDGILGIESKPWRSRDNGAKRQPSVRASSLKSNPNAINIVVATPGRMLDLVESIQEIREQLSEVQVVIFDECDQLLDMGFQKTIQAILECVPKPHDRHTFMFSATLSSPAVRKLAADQLVNKPIHEIDATLPHHDPASASQSASADSELHAHIPQTYALVPHAEWMFTLAKTLAHHVASHAHDAAAPPRVIVFCSTSKMAAYFAKVFMRLPGYESASASGRYGTPRSQGSDKRGVRVYELHARLEQSRRAKVSDAFRRDVGGPCVMFTTDVSARGVDYPHVSLVIQSGAPSSAEQYVHRVGRTGRAGRSGQGLLLLEPFERSFLKELKGRVAGDETVDSWIESSDPENVALRSQVTKAMLATLESRDRHGEDEGLQMAEGLYLAHLGYYRQQSYLSREQCAAASKDFAMNLLQLPKPPTLSLRLAQQMGLMNVRGIEVRGEKRSDAGMSHEPRRGGPREWDSAMSHEPRRGGPRDWDSARGHFHGEARRGGSRERQNDWGQSESGFGGEKRDFNRGKGESQRNVAPWQKRGNSRSWNKE
ncbi:P-loop containing nucleoside triphosphate hydrolase protein [Chytriomyces sp. MP71]|nr:P-loop containing nucleoside triphosphate hydrolase protein [Chytriomyces sp. MP71]